MSTASPHDLLDGAPVRCVALPRAGLEARQIEDVVHQACEPRRARWIITAVELPPFFVKEIVVRLSPSGRLPKSRSAATAGHARPSAAWSVLSTFAVAQRLGLHHLAPRARSDRRAAPTQSLERRHDAVPERARAPPASMLGGHQHACRSRLAARRSAAAPPRRASASTQASSTDTAGQVVAPARSAARRVAQRRPRGCAPPSSSRAISAVEVRLAPPRSASVGARARATLGERARDQRPRPGRPRARPSSRRPRS